MSITNDSHNKPKQSTSHVAIMFVAINCIIVSVLTFSLSAVAVITNNYDKWFPVAIFLTVALFLIGRWLLTYQRKNA